MPKLKVLSFFCILAALNSHFVHAKRCSLALNPYKGSPVSKTDLPLRNFLLDIIRTHRRSGILAKNENLKHLRRMIRLLRSHTEELQKEGINVQLLEVGIYLSDLAKNPELITKYKHLYGDNAFAAFLDHAKLSLKEGELLRQKHAINDAQWNIIQEVILGHDGPSSPGSWWGDNFNKIVGTDYPKLTPGSKYAYIHALFDRMDQGGVYRDKKETYQGGVRKISFDMLKKFSENPNPHSLLQSIDYALNNIYPGSRIQVDELLNTQAHYFPHGIPPFILEQNKLFTESSKIKYRVEFQEGVILFKNKWGQSERLEQIGTDEVLVNGAIRLSVSEALSYFWNKL